MKPVHTFPYLSFLVLVGCASPSVAHRPDAPMPVEDVPATAPVGVETANLAAVLAESRTNGLTWERLTVLCDTYGHRLSGSASLEEAAEWVEGILLEDGHEGVVREPVLVPAWVRGEEKLDVISPRSRSLSLLALGGSVGTPGVEASVVVVHEFADLDPSMAGKIVVYNHPMEVMTPALAGYKDAVQFRSQGASRAAEVGAVAALVRSVTTRSLYTPHTGALRYDETLPRIPAAAITPEDADWLDRMTASGQEVRLRLELGSEILPDATSHNVIGEIRGSEFPEELIVVGAHLDSWDVGQGAHDDGAGVVEVLEALRAIRATGVAPRRTIRAVLFTNEENGLRGGKDYASTHAEEQHVAAIESDLGGGYPLSWGASGSAEDFAWLQQTAAPLGLPVNEGGGGADISPLKEQGTLVIGLRPDDTHYFDIHHTHADTLDKVDPAALAEAGAQLAGLTWLLANADR